MQNPADNQTQETSWPIGDSINNARGDRNDLNPSETDGEFDLEAVLAKIIEDPSLVQHVSRYRTAEAETLVAYVRCDFAKDQQRYILHLPFYPHFQSIPIVTASIQDDIEGRVRVTDQQKFGTRLEITLDKSLTKARQVLIEISANSSTGIDS